MVQEDTRLKVGQDRWYLMDWRGFSRTFSPSRPGPRGPGGAAAGLLAVPPPVPRMFTAKAFASRRLDSCRSTFRCACFVRGSIRGPAPQPDRIQRTSHANARLLLV